MLAGKYPADLASELEPRLTWDRVTGRVSGSRGSRMMAVISGGTIPDRGLYMVTLPDRTRLGELDEEFVHESRVGDVFQLGSATWRIATIEHDRVIVIPAPGAPARMPFWHGEFLTRSVDLSRRVGRLRRELAIGCARRCGAQRHLSLRRGERPEPARVHRRAAGGDGRRAGRPDDPGRAFPGRDGRRADHRAFDIWGPSECAVGDGIGAADAGGAGGPCRRAGPDQRRRHHAPAARSGRRAARSRAARSLGSGRRAAGDQ